MEIGIATLGPLFGSPNENVDVGKIPHDPIGMGQPPTIHNLHSKVVLHLTSMVVPRPSPMGITLFKGHWDKVGGPFNLAMCLSMH